NIENRYPGRVTSRALLGYSMGGFHTLYLAGNQNPAHEELLKFDRYVGVDVPVRLDHAIKSLDDHFNAALRWPEDERTERIELTFHKVAALARRLDTITPDSPIPLD